MREDERPPVGVDDPPIRADGVAEAELGIAEHAGQDAAHPADGSRVLEVHGEPRDEPSDEPWSEGEPEEAGGEREERERAGGEQPAVERSLRELPRCEEERNGIRRKRQAARSRPYERGSRHAPTDGTESS